MKRVAVFGNAGGGKSSLAARLAAATGLPLFVIDLILYPNGYQSSAPGGGKLSDGAYELWHADILKAERWIIDGYGTLATTFGRIDAADTLIFVDLPLPLHYWGVTKRMLSGLFRTPRGWPDGSPLWASSLDSYRVVGRCARVLTPQYRARVATARLTKTVHHIRSRSDVRALLQLLERAAE